MVNQISHRAVPVIEGRGRVPVKAKLLLVEDSESQGNHIKSLLERMGYDVSWAQAGVEALQLARSESPELIVLDVVMRDMDGLAVCRWLKMSPDTRDIPVIMLTVKGELHERVDGLNVGANDYLPKPFADEELEARIFAALRVRSAEVEMRRRNQQLESMLQHVETLTTTDPLTGLVNRRRFADVLRHEFAVTRRYHNVLSCLVVDVDRLKAINDRLGVSAGDQLLSALAQRVGQSLREVDLAARAGGEQFAILLPQTPKAGAVALAERILTRVREEPFTLAGERVDVTVSIGVAAFSDIASSVAEDLVRAAETALALAKGRGRNCLAAYVPPPGVAPV
ncbi:MAG: diguanylate cyclase [Polyangiaceae bacterium]